MHTSSKIVSRKLRRTPEKRAGVRSSVRSAKTVGKHLSIYSGTQSSGIRVALIGVGNVASALAQALQSTNVAGLWHEKVGGFRSEDVKIVAAFDIDTRKVGLDLAEAIFCKPNVTQEFSKIHNTGIIVNPGIITEETPKHLAENVIGTDEFASLLKSSDANIAVNLLPSGMQETSYRYAEASLQAGCSFVNASPARIATDRKVIKRFQLSRLVVTGDDLMSQFGGTAFHKGILEFMNRRGLVIEKSYQLDVGGGSETLNTISETIKLDKRAIKTAIISEEIPYKFQTVAGTTDFVDYMGNNRTSYFWILAKTLFGSEVKIDVYLRTNDGANAANILIDVIRAVCRARMQKRYGSPREISEYGFKKLETHVHLRNAQDKFVAHYC